MAISQVAQDWNDGQSAAYDARQKAAKSCGPAYNYPQSAPVVVYDQMFQADITPAGTVNCPTPLRVGSTNNALDLILVANASNTGILNIAAAATITATLLQADSPDGSFTQTGPTICVKSPTEGIAVEPGHLAARFPLGNFTKPWLKVKLEFSGTINGGTLDAALGYMPR